MKRLFIVCALLSVFAIASALSVFHKTFVETYKIKDDSTLGKAKCYICHTSSKGGKLNAYGNDIKAQMAKMHTKKVTADVLKSVENLDSDKDSVKNIDEIKKDALPGFKPGDEPHFE
ncbi:MAG TPA: hypothetical protein VNI20_00640 [Fimbriimonadaceae bacterium]|nr:hypothetical protein [Fimbriimonadaceae bacterium]